MLSENHSDMSKNKRSIHYGCNDFFKKLLDDNTLIILPGVKIKNSHIMPLNWKDLMLLWLISHVFNVASLWTTDVGVTSLWLINQLCCIVSQSVPHAVGVVSLCSHIIWLVLPYVHWTYSLWSLGIYSYRYYSVSLYFTNWSFLYSLLKSLPKLQPELS